MTAKKRSDRIATQEEILDCYKRWLYKEGDKETPYTFNVYSFIERNPKVKYNQLWIKFNIFEANERKWKNEKEQSQENTSGFKVESKDVYNIFYINERQRIFQGIPEEDFYTKKELEGLKKWRLKNDNKQSN